MTRRSNAVPGIVLLVFLVTASAGSHSLAKGAHEEAGDRTMKGMVEGVNAEKREVRVLTGMGHSLHMMVFRADTECRIRVEGAAAELKQLKRGQVVEVRYRETSARGYEAESIAAAPMPAEGDSR